LGGSFWSGWSEALKSITIVAILGDTRKGGSNNKNQGKKDTERPMKTRGRLAVDKIKKAVLGEKKGS